MDDLSNPWALDGNKNTWTLLDSAGRRIALIDKSGMDAARRARVIAAAPELLAALMRLDEQGHTQETWRFAKAAIAKATP